MNGGVDDSFRQSPFTAALGGLKGKMAVCPRDGEPLVATMEFAGAEFYCQVCGGQFGFLAPNSRTATLELEARHEELRAAFYAERGKKVVTEPCSHCRGSGTETRVVDL